VTRAILLKMRANCRWRLRQLCGAGVIFLGQSLFETKGANSQASVNAF
jgi:hypothetical protein